MCEDMCTYVCVHTHTYRRPFYEKRMSTEMAADFLGDEWKVCGVYTIMYTSEVWGMCVKGICLNTTLTNGGIRETLIGWIKFLKGHGFLQTRGLPSIIAITNSITIFLFV